MSAVHIGELVDGAVYNIARESKKRRDAIAKFKDECLARHKLKKMHHPSGRLKIEAWLKAQGNKEQYWRDTLNRVMESER